MEAVGAPSEPLEFNPFLPEIHADPYPMYRRLREGDPVHPSFPGAWVLTRYRDVQAITRDPARFSSDSRKSNLYEAFRQSVGQEGLGALGEETVRSMLFSDPPDHSRLRTLVSQAFTARVIEGMRPRIQLIADRLVDDLLEQGTFDLVPGLAYPLPIGVICQMLGVPIEDTHLFHRWSQDLVLILDPLVSMQQLSRVNGAVESFRAYFDQLAAERRAHPGDDLLSGLIQAEEQGKKLTADELRSTAVLLLVAGHETTVNLISNAVLALLRHPDQRDLLRSDPSMARGAVEEALRYDSPVQFIGRTLMFDWELEGRRIQRGDQVIGVIGSANRDPEQFDDPDRFVVTRKDVRHLSFSSGIHFCLGAPLARAEGQIALATLARRAPGMRLAGDQIRWRETITLRGLASLPVTIARSRGL